MLFRLLSRDRPRVLLADEEHVQHTFIRDRRLLQRLADEVVQNDRIFNIRLIVPQKLRRIDTLRSQPKVAALTYSRRLHRRRVISRAAPGSGARSVPPPH
jgi:hypothetical protein